MEKPAGADTPPDGNQTPDSSSETPPDTGPELSPHETRMAQLRHQELGEELPPGVKPLNAPDEDEPDPEPEGTKRRKIEDEDDPEGELEGEPEGELEGELEEGDEPEPEPEGELEEGEDSEGEDEPEPEGEPEEGIDDEDLLVFKLPGRREEDGDFELPVDRALLEAAGIDPADAEERVAQLRNMGLRRKELDDAKATIQADQAELETIYADLQEDPSGFILQTVDPAIQEQLAQDLLLGLEEKAFDKLIRTIDGWARDPKARDTARTKAENERLKGADTRRKQTRESAAQKQLTQDIGTKIRSLVPKGMGERVGRAFVKEAAAELLAHCRENKLALEIDDIPATLAEIGVLEEFGISPNGESAAAAEASANGSGKKKRTAKKPSSDASSPKPKGSDVRERLKRRKAAATTPAGAGSSAAPGFKKVPGETYAERRNRLARSLGAPEKDLSGK